MRKIIEDAYSAAASHIHIEPYGYKQDGEVRYRIDGITVLLQEGIHRIFDGVTDFNQVMSVCSQDS